MEPRWRFICFDWFCCRALRSSTGKKDHRSQQGVFGAFHQPQRNFCRQCGDGQLLRQSRHRLLLVDSFDGLRRHLPIHPLLLQLQLDEDVTEVRPHHQLRHEPRVRRYRPVQHLHPVLRQRCKAAVAVQEHPAPPQLLRLRPLHRELRRKVLQPARRAEGDARQHHGNPLPVDCVQVPLSTLWNEHVFLRCRIQ
ncbi:hypothetical protein MUK42_13765 [Musa troglodytarum]|uniref:Uncharacterized protein n=1 Tax=Musa troglodytarum TaxID=320322 RepID=A0A9E7I8C3_9LILI|nr:hypothetical protein MUK42_13765 [Musa troglodytarum]